MAYFEKNYDGNYEYSYYGVGDIILGNYVEEGLIEVSIPAPFEPTVRTLRATIPALGASIPVIGNHHSG